MSDFASRWAADNGEEWEDPEPGTYSVRVVGADAWMSQSGNETVKVSLRITEGPHADRLLAHMMFFGNDVSIRRSKTALSAYGIDLEEITEAGEAGFTVLRNRIERIVGVVAEVAVKINKGYVNIDVGRVLTGESDVPAQTEMFAPAGAPARNAVNDDDDLPY